MKERQAGPGIHELSEREKATILEFRDLVTQSLVMKGNLIDRNLRGGEFGHHVRGLAPKTPIAVSIIGETASGKSTLSSSFLQEPRPGEFER